MRSENKPSSSWEMRSHHPMETMRHHLSLFLLLGIGTLLAGDLHAAAQGAKPRSTWRVPSRHARKKNPQAATPESIAAGRKLFIQECASCHGQTGMGDGPASKDLDVKPADLPSWKVQHQTDGALYWMISTGRSPMPSFKDSIPKEGRWNLVNFLRTLADPLDGVLVGYEQLHQALAESAEEVALKQAVAFPKMVAHLASLHPAELGKDQAGAWKSVVDQLGELAAEVQGAKDLPALRRAFAALGEPMLAALKMLPSAGRPAWRSFRSDLGPDGKPAIWLQKEEKPRNPYQPDQPDTGTLLDVIAASTAQKKA